MVSCQKDLVPMGIGFGFMPPPPPPPPQKKKKKSGENSCVLYIVETKTHKVPLGCQGQGEDISFMVATKKCITSLNPNKNGAEGRYNQQNGLKYGAYNSSVVKEYNRQ